MRIVAGVVSALLILEFSLGALSMLTVMQVAVERFTALTRYHPSTVVVLLIGLFDLLGVIGVIYGFWQPGPAIAAGAYFALLSGTVLGRQVSHGDRGSDLVPYSLFLSAAVILVITRILQRG